jgi:hypothetical protein
MKELFIVSMSLEGAPMAQGPCLALKYKKPLSLVKHAYTLHRKGAYLAESQGGPLEGDRKYSI